MVAPRWEDERIVRGVMGGSQAADLGTFLATKRRSRLDLITV